MRWVREILPLEHGGGAADRMIARSMMSDYLDRVASAGLDWALPPMLIIAAMEALSFARAGIAPGRRRKPGPDWAARS
jgi:hypothetical protein